LTFVAINFLAIDKNRFILKLKGCILKTMRISKSRILADIKLVLTNSDQPFKKSLIFMKFVCILLLTFLIPGFSLITPAQKVATQEKTKNKEQVELEDKTYKLLAEIADDAALLKLGENRAFVYVITGNLLWEKDEKSARRYFSNAVSEFIQVQNNPKKRFQFGNENFNYWTYIHNLLREQIVYGILPRDPQMALETLYSTRPAEIENAVRLYRQIATQTGKNPDLSNYKQDEQDKFNMAYIEIQLERNLSKELGKTDPQKMAENLREIIAGGSNYFEILPDLDALNKKDHATAQKLLDVFIDKLSDEDYLPAVKSYVAYLIYGRVLGTKKKSSNKNVGDKDKELEFDEKKIKTIANREFDKLVEQTPSEADFRYVEYSMYLKKILPERFAEIKPKIDRVKVAREWANDLITADKLGDDPTINQVIENSENLQSNTRNNYYIRIVEKLSKTETPEKIAQTIGKIPDEKDREKTMDYLNSLSAKKTTANNLDETKRAALQIKNEKERVTALINLAVSYHQKHTDESQKIADDLMTEASRLTNSPPETETEFEKFLPILNGYSLIEPKKAFELMPPIIEKSNEIINAYVVMSNYNDKNYPYVSENEIIFPAQDSYSSFSWKYREIIKNLAVSDFEETNNLIKNCQRNDVRIAARLILAQGIFAK
jgi:hypothetical protein